MTVNHGAPVNTVYLSQMNASSLELSLVTERDIELALKVNILFFDHISIGSSGLLCNRMMYDAVCTGDEGIRSLYIPESEGGTGILCPVLSGDSESLASAAKSMLSRSTVHSLPTATSPNDEALISHAEQIDRLSPTTLFAPEDVFRRRFAELVVAVVPRLLSLGTDTVSALGLTEAALRNFDDWLDTHAISDTLYSSDVWRLARDLPSSDGRGLNILSETAYSFSMASTLHTVFSAPEDVVPLVDLCRGTVIDPSGQLKMASLQQSRNDLYADVPLERLLSCSLEDILYLRNMQSFRAFRARIARLRGGSEVSEKGLQDGLADCASEIHEFVHKNPRMKELQRSSPEVNPGKLFIRLLFEPGMTRPIAVSLLAGTFQPKIVYATFAVMPIYAARSLLKGKPATKNSIVPTGGTVHPVDGTIREMDQN